MPNRRRNDETHAIAILLLALFPAACGAGSSGPPAGVTGAGGSGGSGGAASVGGSGGSGMGASTGGGATVDLKLTISTDQHVHPISPWIYGINGAPSAGAAKARLVRLGGNQLSAYDWEVNATNGGTLGGFQNKASSPGATPGAAVKEVLDAAAQNGAAAMVTVPIGDYVAADRLPGDVHASGSDYLSTRFRKNVAVKGTPLLATPDLTDDSVYADELTSWVKGAAGATPVVFSLDNQPELWSEDHTEIHPAKATYDEVVSRNRQFAKAIRAVWPGAPISGAVTYGWQGYENLQNAPDAQSKGDFLSYYLDQMAGAEVSDGGRLIDYLDLHWWPEAQGGGVRITAEDAGPEIVAARLQAPRALWDATYHEVSWIDDTLGGDTIALLPRMKGKIAQHYPGTKLALSAWYYGGGGHISGALATADVLGILGREGVDLAAVDLGDGDQSYTTAAFLPFLDWDGTGKRFGDTSVDAASDDVTGASVYASVESSDPTRVVVIAINKRGDARSATVTIAGSVLYATCSVFTLTAAGPALAQGAPGSAVGPSTFAVTLPAMSVSVIVPQ